MELDNYRPALEEEIGTILDAREWIPGVYNIEVVQEGCFSREYFVVLDTALMAPKAQSYGKKMDGLRLYAADDDSSGWRIVQYEISKYRITVKGSPTPEWMFRDMSLHAMELHPEYFGGFPVPFHTPDGYTLRHRTLANGIYWLETSTCKEFLAVCFPIWDAELSAAAAVCGEMLEYDKADGSEKATPYRFFPKELSCVPVYELLQTRGEWEGAVIDRPALMNAIWKYVPAYAMRLNGQTLQGAQFALLNLLERNGLPVMPEPDKESVIGMFPDTGTDFLLLK